MKSETDQAHRRRLPKMFSVVWSVMRQLLWLPVRIDKTHPLMVVFSGGECL